MATSALSILRKNNNKSILNKSQTVGTNVVAPVEETVQEEREHNTNGFLGGLGYLGEKVGLGFIQGIEGVWDFTAGGIASLTGNDEWAKKQFDTDWVNYNHADEWYNPSSGWQFAGEIAGGIGTSLPTIGAGVATIGIGAGITAATGGTGFPAYVGTIATIMSATIGGLSAAGSATKEAYQETGELGLKEYGYGTLMGGIEAGLEFATAGIGAGTGRIVKEIGESVAGTTAKKVATNVGKQTFVGTILKNGIKDFAGEAFEEGVTTAISPYFKRATYDPNAKNATVQDITYSALTGGFAGLLMGGANTMVSSARTLATGNRLTQKNLANTVLEMGREISLAEEQHSTGYESFAAVKKLYTELSESIKSTNGQVQTVQQKMLLGELNNQATAAIIEPMVERSAMKILSNPEMIAERASAYLTKAGGQKVEIAAQDLMANIDTSSRENYVKSLRKALSSNPKLLALAVADATGTMMVDTKAFEEATLRGKALATQDDFNSFLENAKPDELNSIGAALGIENWENVTYAEFQDKMGEFSANGKLAESIEQTKRIQEAKNIPETEAKKKIPSAFSMKEDGVVRYSEGDIDIAVIKQGEKYFVYDYVDGNITRSLSRTELNSLLNQVKEHNLSFEQARTQRESGISKLAKNFDTYCQDNIKDYKNLNPANKAMIRKIIRDAKAKGISDADALTYARVSARTGIEIEFNKEALKVGKIKGTEEAVYADGIYDGEQNKIIVNPKTKRTHESLLLHELTHAIYKTPNGEVILMKGVENMTDSEKQAINKRYIDAGRGSTIELIDEQNAHYAESQLSNKNLLKKLLADKPTLKDKILSFFKKIMGDSEDIQLSKTAKRLYNGYKKLFDQFSERKNNGVLTEKPVTNAKQEDMFVSKKEKRVLAEARYVIEINDKNIPFVKIDNDILAGVAEKDWIKTVKNNLSTKFPNGVTLGKNVIKIDSQSRKEMTFSKYMKWLKYNNPQAFSDKLRATNNADEILDATQGWVSEGLNHSRKDDIVDFARGTVLLRIGANDYSASVIVGTHKTGKMILYDIIDLTTTKITKKETSAAIPENSSRRVERKTTLISNNSITEPELKVNTESKKSFALPEDVKAPLDTSDSIKLGTPSQYKASFKDKFFSIKDSIYIDTVDEMYGAEKYLKKSGVKNAEATINMMRVATSQAQTMTGSVQYDIYGNKKKLGNGIQKIVEQFEKQGEDVYVAFNEYLLHLHNIDRMTLESRTKAWNEESKQKLAAKQFEYSLKEKAIETADKNISKLKSAKKKLSRKKTDMAKREKYNAEIEKITNQKEKIKKEIAKLGGELRKLQAEVDNFVPMENKPVFGANSARGRAEAITAEQSQERANTLEKQYPEFKKKAEEVHKYFKNLLHMDVQTGKITSEQEELMNKLYPHYVPTIRDGKQPGVKPVKGKYNLRINSAIKKATGGGEDIIHVAYSGGVRTQQIIRSGNVNLLAQKIYEAHLSTADNTYVEVVSTKKMTAEEIADINYDDASMRPKNNQVTFFYNGECITMKVSKEIFAAFEAIDNPSVDPNSAIMKVLNKINKFYKELVTSYSPAFILRNPIRDPQDAGLNSKHPIEFAKNLPLAYKEIASNGKYWELYRAMGGFSSSVFDTKNGFTSKVGKRGLATIEKSVKGIIKSPFTMIENANVVVEQATRLAEFMASIKKGNTPEQALLDSAEVTTNFGRKGKLAKKLNATVMPFLNPAIQGADKIYRNVKDAFVSKNKAKAFVLLVGRAALIGIVPHILNWLLYKDDEDYEMLDETVKENYYLYKFGDKFLRIPKGRLVSVLAGAANRITLMAQGKDPDIKSYLKNMSTQITPFDSMSRTIFSPFWDLATNTTWYGSAIEGRQFENTAPKDRYDESTSSIAIAIGQKINYSPKKIHYLLDQYFGVIGDFILPATTKKAEKDYLSNSFITDPVVSNKLSTEFYKLYDQAQYGKTAGDDKSTYYVKYLNETKNAISKVYKEISTIQNSNLSSSEKLQQTRVLRMAINNMYKSAIDDYEIVGAAIEATAGIDEKFRYTEITHQVYGAERALKTYDDKVYEKCSLFNSAGLDYEILYYYYFATLGLESDIDKEGNTIAGSKRGKIVEVINNLDVSDEEKLLLLCYRGYSIKDGDINGMSKEASLVKMAKYIKSIKGLTNEQKEELAELIGLTYKNGKIIVPSSYKWRKNNKSSVLSLIKGG